MATETVHSISPDDYFVVIDSDFVGGGRFAVRSASADRFAVRHDKVVTLGGDGQIDRAATVELQAPTNGSVAFQYAAVTRLQIAASAPAALPGLRLDPVPSLPATAADGDLVIVGNNGVYAAYVSGRDANGGQTWFVLPPYTP